MEVIWTGEYDFIDVHGSMPRDYLQISMIVKPKPKWKCQEGYMTSVDFWVTFSHLKSANWFYDAIKSGENIPIVVQEHPPGSAPEEQD